MTWLVLEPSTTNLRVRTFSNFEKVYTLQKTTLSTFKLSSMSLKSLVTIAIKLVSGLTETLCSYQLNWFHIRQKFKAKPYCLIVIALACHVATLHFSTWTYRMTWLWFGWHGTSGNTVLWGRGWGHIWNGQSPRSDFQS
jgi:hypothetical protein